ncbi:hypothetical protein NC651_004790 [Populus alba x Populus x berolinensis]|nr:hypothetical protein NC651_004790 [Populus alba x Populus x berolinensis]
MTGGIAFRQFLLFGAVNCLTINFAFPYLSYNQINGSIPLEIWNLAKLETLDLSSNNISGSIHSRAGSLTTELMVGWSSKLQHKDRSPLVMSENTFV